MINRERARQIASKALGEDCNLAVRGTIRAVMSPEEITFRLPCIYGFPAEVLKDFWIAYVEQEFIVGLGSSVVILVSKGDGRIAYMGSASDEG